jgi:hypothetical protein
LTRNERWAQLNVRAGWANIVGLEPATGRVTRIARLSINGTTDAIRDSTWLDDVVPQLFDVENLPAQFMPGRGDNSNVAQSSVRHLIADNSADYWQAESDQEQNGNGANNEVDETMETSTIDPQAHPVANNSGTEAHGPVGVGSVEQNLARLAIVTTSST